MFENPDIPIILILQLTKFKLHKSNFFLKDITYLKLFFIVHMKNYLKILQYYILIL